MTSGTTSKLLVAGARPYSLGAALLKAAANYNHEVIPVAIDIEPVASDSGAMFSRQVDLNPCNGVHGWQVWSNCIHLAIQEMDLGRIACPYRNVVLASAKYHLGSLEGSTLTQRADIIGMGVMGKLEVLHATMAANSAAGFDNSSELCVLDVGSFHAVRRSNGRALYNISKEAGLALCEVLASEGEVRRVVHLSPGPMDTSMLHWNHWVLKENGHADFFEYVRLQTPTMYRSIFMDGNRGCFLTAVAGGGFNPQQLLPIYERYIERRSRLASSEVGISDPMAIAMVLVPELLDGDARQSEFIEVTSPGGVLQLQRRPLVGG